MKRIALIATLCLSLALTGCANGGLRRLADQQAPQIVLSDAAPAEGDSVGARDVDVMLFFPTADGQALASTQASLIVTRGESAVSCALNALLADPDDAALRRAVPEGTRVRGLYRSGDVLLVDLTLDARAAGNGWALFLMRESIVRTLAGIEGTEAVDVLVNGRAETPFMRPVGAEMAEDADVVQLFARRQAETETVYQRQALIWYPTGDGTGLLPVLRPVTIEGDGVKPLIEALCQDDGLSRSLRAIDLRSEDVTEAAIRVLEDGRRVAALTLRSGASLSPCDLAAVTATLTGFLPALDGVALLAEGEETLCTRRMAEDWLRDGVPVYLADGGKLVSVVTPMRPVERDMPRLRLKPLFEGVPAASLSGCMPQGVGLEDILGLRVEGGEAALNLSSRLGQALDALDAARARAVVFAMVNTLTEMESIDRVRFQIEGRAVEALENGIYLSASLRRNTGLILPDAAR